MARKAAALEEKGYRKFGIRDSIAYAAGDFGCNMSFALKSTMAIFWTQFMGLELWYSLLLVIVQVWDAINDPLIGSIVDADKHQYKRNKFLQYIWVGSIGLIVGGALCFIPAPNAPLWAKLVIFVAGYVIWDAFYTVANVPYGSLLSLISGDPADRASLSAWRSVGSMIGNMVPMVILPFIIYDSNNDLIGERVFVARQFFCETRTRFLRKNHPFLRSKSETRSLASTAPLTEGELPMQKGGFFRARGGAVFPPLPLLLPFGR